MANRAHFSVWFNYSASSPMSFVITKNSKILYWNNDRSLFFCPMKSTWNSLFLVTSNNSLITTYYTYNERFFFQSNLRLRPTDTCQTCNSFTGSLRSSCKCDTFFLSIANCNWCVATDIISQQVTFHSLLRSCVCLLIN